MTGAELAVGEADGADAASRPFVASVGRAAASAEAAGAIGAARYAGAIATGAVEVDIVGVAAIPADDSPAAATGPPDVPGAAASHVGASNSVGARLAGATRRMPSNRFAQYGLVR
jgi:hypothetical protein